MPEYRYGSKVIEYKLHRSNRKTLGIIVTPQLEVVVKAPLEAEKDLIEGKIKKRSRWILRQLRIFERYHPLTKPKKHISGETHLYLGRQYRLKVMISDHSRVRLMGAYIFVEAPASGDVRNLLNEWYNKHAHQHFEKYINDYIDAITPLTEKSPKLHLRRMKKRWGSCSPSGNITLNPDLIQAPSDAVRYVVLHELCHLVHPRHDKKFYSLLSDFMPDWRNWKEILEVKMA